MLLKNKKTGEIRDFIIKKDKIQTASSIGGWEYTSLANLCKEWEDVPEEPKEYWFINSVGGVIRPSDTTDWEQQDATHHKEIGNYFETEEEAEKAVEKLKALKRLKDEGMIKYSFHREKGGIDLDFYTLTILAPRDKESLDLLFGGEE